MTFTTLTYNGTEKTLADWGISTAQRQVSNQAGDNFAFDMMLAADAADPFPYGAQITIQIGRTGGASATSPSGLPNTGLTGFSGGKIWFVGYRVDTFRTGSPSLEKLAYKFAGPWEFFFERLVFQKLWWTWNGTENVADWRSQVILGQSVNALVGPNDTVPGSDATNLMSIAQQIKEIAAYVINETTATYGSPQLQFDPLTAVIDGTNYDLLVTPSAHCLVPDFIAGFSVSGKTSQSANQITMLRAPLDAVNDVTCADAMRRMLRWIGALGSPVVWFDYSTVVLTAGVMTAGPTLNVSTRDQLPSISLPFSSSPLPLLTPVESVKIKRRDDLIPGAISLKFRITTSNNGQSVVQVVNDIATTISGAPVEGIGITGRLQTPANFVAQNSTLIASGTQTTMQNTARGFASSMATIDMEGAQQLSATIGCVPVDVGDPSSDASALTFWATLFPESADATNLALYDASGAPATVIDDTNTAVDLSIYNYRLTKGQIAPWMVATTGAAGVAKKCTVKAKFSYTQNSSDGSNTVANSTVKYHEKTATITLTNLAGGTYGIVNAGEVVPYGLAGFIYNIESIPQYEGTFTLQETEITDQCPLGNNLNLTGALAEWATMNACVQSISYDLTNGRTTLTFGPAGHLGAKDFVERLRVNRGPRWYYSIGGNMLNSSTAGTELGNFTPDQGPSPNNAVPAILTIPTSVSDWLTNASSYTTGVPGITHDGAPSSVTQPNYGGITAPNAPVHFGAVGSGGTLSSFYYHDATGTLVLQVNGSPNVTIQLKVTDLPGGFKTNSSGNYVLKLREVTDCVTISGTPTTVYRQALVSAYYTSALGNT
jgi:hypothetical protein